MGRAHGGTQLVAASAGGRRARGSYKRWSEELIRDELSEFLADRDKPGWPTQPEFRDSGHADLLDAIDRYGGVRRWAREFGVELRPGQDRRRYTPAQAVADARRVFASEGAIPNTKRLRELGYNRLATFIQKAGGVGAFCREHGIE